MLADGSNNLGHAGALAPGIHLPGEWLNSLIRFIANALPSWRDDLDRDPAAGETRLTSQLCARLASLTRHTPGWDIVQFRREEQDENDRRRAIDLAAAPCGETIWIAARRYRDYDTILPIECKRLPTPAGRERDEREYLIDKYKTAGGVQRFKAGHHGAAHSRAAMIGYVQSEDIQSWKRRLDQWLEGIVAEPVEGWSVSDRLAIVEHLDALRVAALKSSHIRKAGLSPIQIDHLWIEM